MKQPDSSATPRRAVQMTTLTLALVATSLAFTGACSRGDATTSEAAGHSSASQTEIENAIAVRVAAVTRAPISSLYSTSATLRADRRATVIARTRGVIHRLLVEEGDQVVAEQPLAELENDEQRITAARARTTRDTSGHELERLSGLLERGLVSEDEYERSRRDADDAEHALQLAELELSRTIIRAPLSGVILHRHLDVGATVSDGTSVYELADLDPLYADINIPERHVTRLSPGQRVNLTADSTKETVAAAIERIAPVVDTTTGTVKVTVAVEGSTLRPVEVPSTLRPGAFVRVDIVTDTHADALVVARSALVAEGRRWHIYRLAEDDTVRQVEVEIGFEAGDRVELATVMSDEEQISAGTRVVVVGAPALSDGALVQIMPDDDQDSDQAESPEEPAEARHAG